MEYLTIPPHPELRQYVRYYWVLNIEDKISKTLHIKTFVDDSTGIIIHHQGGRSAVRKQDEAIPTAIIYGQTTTPSVTTAISGFNAIGVLFYPHVMSSLFRINASEFKDKYISFDGLETVQLQEALFNAPHLNQQLKILDQYLHKKILQIKKEDMLIKDCIERIKLSCGRLTVRELSLYYKISEKQLERRFNSVVGVTPRHYIKVTRFNKAISLLKESSGNKLSEIAHHLDYFDQSHFIRHVKEFSGYKPKDLKQLLNTPINFLFKKNDLTPAILT